MSGFDISKFPVFDFAAQQPALDYLVETFRRQISRHGVEWNRMYRIGGDGLAFAVNTALELGIETWAAVRFLCREGGEEPRSLRLAAALPPLARVLAELIYWHVYLFDNPAANYRKFERAIWAKTHDRHLAHVHRYGRSPQWKAWIREHEDHRNWLARRARITPAENGQSHAIAKEWPLPGRMLRDLQGRRYDFLKFIDDWYYGRLSQSIHFTGDGFMNHLAHLLFMNDGLARKYRSDLLVTSYTLFLSLLSELALDVTRVGHPIALLRELWTDFGSIFGFAQEVWKEGYEQLFAGRRHSI